MSDHATRDDEPAVETTIAFRRSLRASRDRRVQAARRRRRLFRGRGAVVVATGLLAVGSAGAFAQQKVLHADAPATAAAGSIKAAQAALGITADGVAGPQTRRAVKSFQRRRGLAVDGVIGPQTLSALGVKAVPDGTATATAGAGGDQLQQIAQCESGGNATAVSPDGKYHGKYQFDQPTWQRMGGTGDPAAAPEAEQDQRAAALLQQQGPSAWPNCA